jgi:hypothetical protein
MECRQMCAVHTAHREVRRKAPAGRKVPAGRKAVHPALRKVLHEAVANPVVNLRPAASLVVNPVANPLPVASLVVNPVANLLPAASLVVNQVASRLLVLQAPPVAVARVDRAARRIAAALLADKPLRNRCAPVALQMVQKLRRLRKLQTNKKPSLLRMKA